MDQRLRLFSPDIERGLVVSGPPGAETHVDSEKMGALLFKPRPLLSISLGTLCAHSPPQSPPAQSRLAHGHSCVASRGRDGPLLLSQVCLQDQR